MVFDSRQLVDTDSTAPRSPSSGPPLKSATTTDIFRFYIGPHENRDPCPTTTTRTKNAFEISGLNADKVVTSSILIGWLATLMKYVLDFFYLLIPNYGIAIILLTLVTKLVFLPLTFSSSESMAKMAALNPKMAEIRARLKDKPDKMNQEIARAVQEGKGKSPLGVSAAASADSRVLCPVQPAEQPLRAARGHVHPGLDPRPLRPRVHPELRLRHPAARLDRAARPADADGGKPAPLQQVHAAPSTTPQQGGAQAKLMMYALPVVFLFILYDMPSGLVLYWTVQNILSTVQQVYINS